MAVNRVIFKNNFDIKVSRGFYRYYTLRHSTFMYFLVLMGLVSVLYITLGQVDMSNTFQAIVIYSVAAVGIVFMPTYTLASILSSANRDRKKRGGQVEIYEVTKDKIERKVEGVPGRNVCSWGSLESVVEANNAYYFFTNEQEAFTIGKAGLMEGSLDLMRHLIKNHLPADKKGKVRFIIKDREYKKELRENKKQQKIKAKENKAKK